MAVEKRTVKSEMREFFAEINDHYQKWRLRGRAQPISRIDTSRSDTLTPEPSEITFTPITLDMDDVQPAGGPGAQTEAGAAAIAVCPITRQTLKPATRMYQCRQCGIYYSTEGWEFLRQTARGQCCGCRGVNTVLPVVGTR